MKDLKWWKHTPGRYTATFRHGRYIVEKNIYDWWVSWWVPAGIAASDPVAAERVCIDGGERTAKKARAHCANHRTSKFGGAVRAT